VTRSIRVVSSLDTEARSIWHADPSESRIDPSGLPASLEEPRGVLTKVISHKMKDDVFHLDISHPEESLGIPAGILSSR
jgi:hypothetical protein